MIHLVSGSPLIGSMLDLYQLNLVQSLSISIFYHYSHLQTRFYYYAIPHHILLAGQTPLLNSLYYYLIPPSLEASSFFTIYQYLFYFIAPLCLCTHLLDFSIQVAKLILNCFLYSQQEVAWSQRDLLVVYFQEVLFSCTLVLPSKDKLGISYCI